MAALKIQQIVRDRRPPLSDREGGLVAGHGASKFLVVIGY